MRTWETKEIHEGSQCNKCCKFFSSSRQNGIEPIVISNHSDEVSFDNFSDCFLYETLDSFTPHQDFSIKVDEQLSLSLLPPSRIPLTLRCV
jgi:hypothetical protein